MRSLRKHTFDAVLLAVAVLCFVLMLIASNDPVPESLRNTPVHAFLKQFTTGNQIVFDLAVGVLAAIFMYYLVVRVPEESKRRRVRDSLRSTYESCKEVCTAIYLGCFMPSYPADLPRALSDMTRFREFFKEDFSSGQTKWDAVANGLTEDRLRALVVELELLMQEIHFALTSVDVRDPNALRFLKHLSRALYRSKNWSTDYDSTKSLLGFLWSFHTGWSWVDGYRPTDPVADMIAAI